MFIFLPLSLFLLRTPVCHRPALVEGNSAITTQQKALHFRYFPQRAATLLGEASGREHVGIVVRGRKVWAVK